MRLYFIEIIILAARFKWLVDGDFFLIRWKRLIFFSLFNYNPRLNYVLILKAESGSHSVHNKMILIFKCLYTSCHAL